MTAKKAPALTDADRAALLQVPDSDWFGVQGARISPFRLQRLVKAGALEYRLNNPSITNAVSIYAEPQYRLPPKPVADWSQAPEGATHVMRSPGSERVVWIKIAGPADAFWRWPGAKNWRPSTEVPSVLLHRPYIEPRPSSDKEAL